MPKRKVELDATEAMQIVQQLKSLVDALNASLAQTKGALSGMGGGAGGGLGSVNAMPSPMYPGMASPSTMPSGAFAVPGAGVAPSWGAAPQTGFGGLAGNTAFQQMLSTPSPGIGPLSPDMFNDRMSYLAASGQLPAISRGFNIGAATMGVGARQLTNAYVQQDVTGNVNPLGVGSALGLVGAGAIGMGAAAMGSTVAGPIGLAAAAILPPLINAVQAPFVATQNAQMSLMPYAASTGQSVQVLASAGNARADRIADYLDDRGAGVGNGGPSWDGFKQSILRPLGVYTGLDQTNRLNDADTTGALIGGMQEGGLSGAEMGPGDISAHLQKKFGLGAPGVARTIAKVFSAIPDTGNNMTDLYRKVGAAATGTLLNEQGKSPAEIDAFMKSGAAMRRADYDLTGAQSVAQGSVADYEASGYSGRSTKQRSGEFGAMMGSLQGQVSAVNADLAAIDAMPGRASSNEHKAKAALRSEMLKSIAAESSARAQGMISDISVASASTLSGDAVGISRAGLYGSAGDIRAAGGRMQGDLASEASDLRTALKDPNLSYQDRRRTEAQIHDIDRQLVELPARTAGAAMRRGFLGSDVAQSGLGLGLTRATMYGSDDDLGKAAYGSVAGFDRMADDATRAASDPNLSAEDRAAALLRANSAQGQSLAARAGSRDTLLGRLSARAGIAETTAGVGLQRAAMIGTGADVRAASGASVAALQGESDMIGKQLAAGGLTVDQELRLKQRQAVLPGEIFSTQQGAIDLGNQKEDLSGFGLKDLKLRGERERLNLMPFSPGSMLVNSAKIIQNDEAQLQVLSKRERDLRAGGNLSPERQYQIEQQRQGLQTDEAANFASLSSGMENRLPGLSAGRPRGAQNFDSMQLAALAYRRVGSPIRDAGAIDGHQAHDQAAAMHDLLGSRSGPTSTTQGLNNSANVVAAMDRLTNAIERSAGRGGGGSGTRPGESAGQAYSVLTNKDPGNRNNGAN
jgi:hypothetical protein